MKKRMLALIFAAFVAASMAGCGSTATDTGSAKVEKAQTEQAEQPKESDEGDLGGVHMKIKSGSVVSAEDGDMLRVVVEFENTSDETTSYMMESYMQAFQNGKELEQGYWWGDEEDEEYNNGMLDLRPGKSLDCAEFFFLEDDEAPVEIELSNPLSSDTVLKKTFEIQ